MVHFEMVFFFSVPVFHTLLFACNYIVPAVIWARRGSAQTLLFSIYKTTQNYIIYIKR